MALTITNSRYYSIADTLCGPQQKFLFFYTRYQTPWKYIFLQMQHDCKSIFYSYSVTLCFFYLLLYIASCISACSLQPEV